MAMQENVSYFLGDTCWSTWGWSVIMSVNYTRFGQKITKRWEMSQGGGIRVGTWQSSKVLTVGSISWVEKSVGGFLNYPTNISAPFWKSRQIFSGRTKHFSHSHWEINGLQWNKLYLVINMMCIDSYHLSLLKHPCKKDQRITELGCQKWVCGLGRRTAGSKVRGVFVKCC